MTRRSPRARSEPRPGKTRAVRKKTELPSAPAKAPPGVQSDGRRERSARSREQVLDALLALLGEGHYSPSMQELSERAGVSRRLVFQLFRDAESMHTAFVERQQASLRELFTPIPDSLPLPTRILSLCEQRARIYEKITHTRRAGMIREYASPMIRRGLTMFRALKRAQVAAIFAPEIRSCHESVQQEIEAALAAAASFNTWESLRAHQQLSIEEAQRTLVHLLTGILRLTPAGGNLIILLGPKSAS